MNSDFKENVLPYLTFLAALISIGTLIFKAVNNTFIDSRFLLIANFLGHVILTFYVIYNGFKYKVDLKKTYSGNSVYHENLKCLGFSNLTQFENAGRRAGTCLIVFLKCWFFACIVWFLYYVIFLADEMFHIGLLTDYKNSMNFVFSAFNYIESTCLIACYYILSYDSYDEDKFSIPHQLRVWFVFISLFFIADLILRIKCLNDSNSDFGFAADIVAGLFSCIGLSMLTAKLSSKFLNIRNFLLVFLFIYALVQVLFPISLWSFEHLKIVSHSKHAETLLNMTIKTETIVTVIVYYIALAGKGILFMLLFTRTSQHRLFLYFIVIPSIAQKFSGFDKKHLKEILD